MEIVRELRQRAAKLLRPLDRLRLKQRTHNKGWQRCRTGGAFLDKNGNGKNHAGSTGHCLNGAVQSLFGKFDYATSNAETRPRAFAQHAVANCVLFSFIGPTHGRSARGNRSLPIDAGWRFVSLERQWRRIDQAYGLMLLFFEDMQAGFRPESR